jgi:amino acid transporter
MSDYSELDKKQDVHILHSMGYAQELERRMSSFSNFAISFSIICILSGGINSLAQATSGAGGAAIGIGWPIGCLISGVFALAMAQISSAYPTAGGLYHWGSILGNRFTGWLTAWLNLLGLITVLGAINAGTWGFFAGSIGGWIGMNVDTTTSAGFANQIIFVAVITGLQALINHFGIKLTAKLTDMSGYLIFAAALALTIVCLIGIRNGISAVCGPSPTTPARRRVMRRSGRRPTISGISLRWACCCRSIRSPATMPPRIHPKKPSRHRSPCQGA